MQTEKSPEEIETIDGIYSETFWIGLTPDPLLNVSEWADKYRMLSQKTSAEPGQWRTSRVPYLREIMDSLSPMCPNPEVVFMKGSQVGGTEAGNNWISYVVDVTSGTLMSIQPTVDLAKRNSKLRIDPMLEDCARLKEKISERRDRDASNTMLMKEFPGGILVFTGANSAAGLRSLPCRFIFADEIDAYPGDVDGEGDPVMLAKARTRTFSRRKIFLVSTPTIAGQSKIEAAYDASDQRRYFVPCPFCNELQYLKWAQVKWPKGEPAKAYYQCEHCPEKIEEFQKTEILAKGKWIAQAPGEGKAIGFHLSALYSPVGWYSWGQAADEFLKAVKGGPSKLRVFANTVLGETWKEKGDAPDWKRLYERREPYKMGTVPPGVLFITAGADVQKDRIEVEFVGYGKGKESWSIEYEIIMGETSTPEPWNKLDVLINRQFFDKRKVAFPVRMIAIDSGYNTNEVYNWVRKHAPNKVIAVKGREDLMVSLGVPTAIDVNVRGTRLKKGIRVWPVGVSLIKTELYGWLNLEKPLDGEAFPPGFCHFPQYDEEFFQQLTAERLITRTVRSQKKYIWEKDRDRNEALDCRVYARAAAASLGMDRLTDEDWDQLAAEIGALSAPLAGSLTEEVENETVAAAEENKSEISEAPNPPPKPTPTPPQRRKTNWL